MEIEQVMKVDASPSAVWDMLLDPRVMGGCVPGMQSIEVLGPTEYVALMHVKISFVSAKFKLRTTVVEQRAPHYLRSEGTGEDSSVASSLKQHSEIFLNELPDGGTELKMKVQVDVVGRLGSFGLSVMKTKADRMWEEFGRNLAARLEAGAPCAPMASPGLAPAEGAVAAPAPAPANPVSAGPSPTAVIVDDVPAGHDPVRAGGWLDRLLSRGRPAADGRSIRIEVKRADTTITVHWPLEAAAECAALLRDAMR